MRKNFIHIFILALVAGLLSAGTASAENSLRAGAKGLSFGVANGDIEVSGRMFLQSDLAILAGFGFNRLDNDETLTDYALSVGLRKYIGKSDVAPFVGGNLFSRHDDEFTGAGVVTERTVGVEGNFGAEYFFNRQVSAEARVGLGLEDSSNHDFNKGADGTAIGTFRSAVGVNIYF